MPKKYEDEIRDILKGMDRTDEPRRVRRPSFGGMIGLGRIDPQRMMGGALILMLFGWLLRGPWVNGYPLLAMAASYVSLAAFVLFVVAFVMLIRAGGIGGGGYRSASGPVRWRGQVIEVPRRGGPGGILRRWWNKLTRRSGPRRPGGRGRDSFQW